MPYVIRKTDGSVQLILQDGLVDKSTGLNLVGRSFTGYGDLIAENFVRLLENFASDTAPASPLDGQIWFDKSEDEFKYFFNNQWQPVAQIGATGPSGPTGPDGPTGPTGIEGPTGPSGPVPNWNHTGEYNDTRMYSLGDLVTFDGELYYRIDLDNSVVGYDPTESTESGDPSGYWRLVATRGETGELGYTGSAGPTGPIPAWNHTGEYDNTVVYMLGDLVTYNGQLYHRTDVDNTVAGQTPGGAGNYWQLVATRGIQGAIGFTGSRGIGYDGSQGEIGYTGSRGVPGFPGSTGTDGYTGSQGNIGYTGSQGTTGYTGSTGDLTFAGQTITGTVNNGNIVLNPIGDGSVTVNSALLPGANNFYALGNSSLKWTRVYADLVEADGFKGVTPPTTSIGAAGDYRGKIAFNSQYFYYCAANYNGVTSIWKRIAWSADIW